MTHLMQAVVRLPRYVMDLSREHFRAMIFYDFKVGLSVKECLERLRSAFGDSSPSQSTVYEWYSEFRRGRKSLEDEPREGRPQTATTEENISSVQMMLKDDPRCTYQQIQQTLGIGSSAVSRILHDNLGVRKVCSRWIPHRLSQEQKAGRVNWCKEMLQKFEEGRAKQIFDIVTGDESWIYQFDPETKQQSTIWIFPDERAPTKTKRSRSIGKKMVCSFFSASGHVATVALEDQRTVTAHWYTTVCLPKVFESIQKRRPKRGVRGLLLHHDNAPAHTAQQTKKCLAPV